MELDLELLLALKDSIEHDARIDNKLKKAWIDHLVTARKEFYNRWVKEDVHRALFASFEDEAQQLPELRLELLGGAEDVGVVHGQAADTGQAVQDPGLLVPVHGAELEQRHGQLAVAAAP